MPTDHAIQECTARKDGGVNLGKPSLQAFKSTLQQFQRNSRPWTEGSEVYHESDVVEDADIRELIGVVRTYPFNVEAPPEPNHFRSPYDYHKADLIFIGPPFLQTIKARGRGRVPPAGRGRGRVPSAGGKADGRGGKAEAGRRAGRGRGSGPARSKPGSSMKAGSSMEDCDDNAPVFGGE
jgi:hypothetical protein